MNKRKGDNVQMSGYTVCDTVPNEQYANKRYDEADTESRKESVFLEIILFK